MSYHRRYNRVYRKKRVYKRRYPLKKSNIFGRRSSKSQARQIYALNKKVNKIQKMTKPEIYIYENLAPGSYGNWDWQPVTGLEQRGRTYQSMIIKDLMNESYNPGETFKFDGDICRIQDMKLYCELWRTARASNYYDTIYRITLMKLTKPTVPTNTYIHNTNNHLLTNPQSVVYGPLRADVTAYGKVVYDRKIKLLKEKGGISRNFKIKLPGNVLRKNALDFSYSTLGNDYMLCISFGHIIPGSDYAVTGDDMGVKIGVKVSYVDDSIGETTSKSFHKDLNPASILDEPDIIPEKVNGVRGVFDEPDPEKDQN